MHVLRELLCKRMKGGPRLLIWAGILLLITVPANSQREKVVILQTADIHGKIGSRETQSGWAHVAGVVARLRQKHENTLLVDCGDAVQGSLLARQTRGRSSIRMLDVLDYDVFVPGNHETDFGVRRFIELMQLSSPAVLCGNVKTKSGSSSLPSSGWRIFKRGNVRIGIIGVTSGLPPAQTLKLHSEKVSLRFTALEKALKRVLPEVLTQNPDTIILALHGGRFQSHAKNQATVSKLVYNYPEIDLILGGHTHQSCGGRRAGYRSWYVQPGAYGERVGVISVTVDTESGRIERMSSRLSDTAEYSALRTQVKETLRQLQRKNKHVKARCVGTTSQLIRGKGRPGVSCGSSALVSRAIAENTRAEVVFYGKHNNSSLERGKITEQELFKLLPYSDKVGIIPLTPEEVEQIVVPQMQKEPLESLGLWGVKVRVNGQKAELVTDEEAEGEKKKYVAAFNAFSLASAEKGSILAEIRNKHKSRIRVSDKRIFKIVKKYIKEHGPVNLDLQRWIKKAE